MIASLHTSNLHSDLSSDASSDSTTTFNQHEESHSNDDFLIASLHKIQKRLENKQHQRRPSVSFTVKQNNLHCSFCGQRKHTKDECWLRGPQFQPKTMSQYTHQFNLKHGNKPPTPSTRRDRRTSLHFKSTSSLIPCMIQPMTTNLPATPIILPSTLAPWFLQH